MAYVTAALRLIESYLAASGRFSGGVTIGQPPAPPETPAAAVFLVRGSAGLLTIGNFRRLRDVTVRIYLSAMDEPRDDVEISLDEIVYDTEASISTDLNLSTSGWIIMGDLVSDYDYAEVGGRLFRIADLVLPLSYQG